MDEPLTALLLEHRLAHNLFLGICCSCGHWYGDDLGNEQARHLADVLTDAGWRPPLPDTQDMMKEN